MDSDRQRHSRILRWESTDHLAICAAALLLAATALAIVTTTGTAKWVALKEKVNSDAAAEGVSAVVRHDLLGLLEVGDGFMRILKGNYVLVLVVAVLGIVREARTLLVTRRVLTE